MSADDVSSARRSCPIGDKQGRVRTFRLAPEPLTHAERWISAQRDLWDRRLDQLDDHLRTMKDMQP